MEGGRLGRKVGRGQTGGQGGQGGRQVEGRQEG